MRGACLISSSIAAAASSLLCRGSVRSLVLLTSVLPTAFPIASPYVCYIVEIPYRKTDGTLEQDLTQTLYSTIPIAVIELGNQYTKTDTESLEKRAESERLYRAGYALMSLGKYAPTVRATPTYDEPIAALHTLVGGDEAEEATPSDDADETAGQ